MATEQIIKTYEVGFTTEKFQHIFYISCPEDVDAKTFAHAVFHFYDTPADWGKKHSITAIAVVNPKSCLPDFMHISMQSKNEVPMPEENEDSHMAVRKVIRQTLDDGYIPMSIYDEENKIMIVYATKKLEVAPLSGASSVVMNFSNFGGIKGKSR